MAKVDMNLLKQLRKMTSAPLKDCKEALIESNGDLDQAVEILKKKGAMKAAKKADRETNEGIVRVRKEGDLIIGVKIACETDFVAKNDTFLELADKIIDEILSYEKENGYIEISSLEDLPESLRKKIVDELIPEYIGKIGENIRLLDVFARKGQAYVYSHPGNKVVAVVFYKCVGDTNCDEEAKEIALQIAAMNPQYLSRELIPEDVIESMKKEFMEELKDSGKPEDILERIVEGKINKELSETTLMEQPYIRDDSKKIKEIIKNIQIDDFIRFSI